MRGSADTTVVKDGSFTDPGATAMDAVEGDLSAQIIIGGETVDISTLGTYVITYDISDSQGNQSTQLKRNVIVTDAPDTTLPVITLAGGVEISHEAGTVFVDPGFSAADDRDGDLTVKVVVTGTVDTANLGTYTLSYNVSDAAGNAAVAVTRKVTVTDTTAPILSLKERLRPMLKEALTTPMRVPT